MTILADTMSGGRTRHRARLAHGDVQSWEVSWLPGRLLNRNSAITAMVLADTVACDDIHAGHRLWPHIKGWADELALTVPEVLAQISNEPSWADTERTCELDNLEAAE